MINNINGNILENPKYIFPNIPKLINKKIIIYGAGKVGRDFYAQFVKNEKIKIVSWVDKEPEKYSYSYYSIRLNTSIVSEEFDYIIIAVLKEKIKDEIIAMLKSFNIPEDKILWDMPIVESSNINITNCKEIGYNIIKIMGGIGNQMFQYALYKALILKGITTKCDISSYLKDSQRSFELLKVFPNVHLDIENTNNFVAYNNPLNNHLLFQEKEDGVFDETIFIQKDASICGYWQSEKYFVDISDIIREDFIFSPKDEDLIAFAKIILLNKNAVSLHVRRGDYLKFSEIYGGICTLNYYKQAMKYVEKQIQHPKYYIFSDDLAWVKENINISNAIYVSADLFSNYKNWYDMYLMSCCSHNIIANSSFSWWGAWLNNNPNKIVIAPNKWLNGKTTRDLWSKEWIRI